MPATPQSRSAPRGILRRPSTLVLLTNAGDAARPFRMESGVMIRANSLSCLSVDNQSPAY
ncbi:hypothetical protein K443DRAFT_11351 [Laccaria amethystina LaAM-08-1]|uniref:Uncharacterized protein n=1 Tax=Laccaria amethystina LaAM-08-1 TaxID=1095629 RepID=A0A0C9XCQ6_9AGAR|nr:hypothetical protein K443DRAFT_11351 [Laccaria amethystina LaAM-08-1]